MQLEGLLEDWDDANTLAARTSRIALGPAIARLQEIRRDVRALKPPECATEVQSAYVEYMDAMIEGSLLFMADEPDLLLEAQFLLAEARGDLAVMMLANLKLDR